MKTRTTDKMTMAKTTIKKTMMEKTLAMKMMAKTTTRMETITKIIMTIKKMAVNKVTSIGHAKNF